MPATEIIQLVRIYRKERHMLMALKISIAWRKELLTITVKIYIFNSKF